MGRYFTLTCMKFPHLRIILVTPFLIGPFHDLSADVGAAPSPSEVAELDLVVEPGRDNPVSDWSLELGSGILFSNVRNPDDIRPQTAVPLQLTAALAVDDVSLDDSFGGWMRGYTEFLFRVSGGFITEGQEDHFVGMEFGPRYNFVQEGWKLVPFVEGTVGFWFVDSDPVRNAAGDQRGFGQDFNFMFSVAAGARYDFDAHWFARAALVYTHVSNAGLSEPQFDNEAFDGLGPQLSLGYRF